MAITNARLKVLTAKYTRRLEKAAAQLFATGAQGSVAYHVTLYVEYKPGRKVLRELWKASNDAARGLADGTFLRVKVTAINSNGIESPVGVWVDPE